ncbi:MAG: 4Fe-4S binding protein [Clostridia bacterium]|nr:4Fe-4S binding protein [Clostridia bacterium]
MAFKISDDCIACGACVESCPCDCIVEGDGKYVINAEECISCGTCAGSCPVGAPTPDEE